MAQCSTVPVPSVPSPPQKIIVAPAPTSWTTYIVHLSLMGAIVGILMRLYHVEQRLDHLEQEESYQMPQFRPIPVTPPPAQHAPPPPPQEEHDQEEEEYEKEFADEESPNQNSPGVDPQDPIEDDEEPPPSS